MEITKKIISILFILENIILEVKMNNKYVGYIYIIRNKLDLNKVYIGQTQTNLKQRWSQHKSSARHAKNSKIVFYKAINKYGEDNFYIEELEKVICSSKDLLIDSLNDLEIYYIALYDSLVPNGYNLTKGGGNCSIRNNKSVTSYFYDGTIDKTFESAAEAGRYYKVDSSHILQCCNGRAQSCRTRIWRYKDDSFNKYEITITKKQLEEGCVRKIDKYSLDGTFIKTYETISDAVRDDENVKLVTPITYCCNGKYNQAYGYVWREHGTPFDYYKWKKNEKLTPVDVYTLNKEYLDSYKSITEAIKSLNLNLSSHSHISDCCKGNRLSCNGYIWRYSGDDLESHQLTRKERSCQIFNRYDLNNNYIETIYGIKNLSHTPNIVQQCCNGELRYIKDSKYFYADDINNPDKSKIIGTPNHYNTDGNLECEFNKFISPICVYDRYGNLLREYLNARKCSKAEKVSTQVIYDVCDGVYICNNDLVYRYKKDDFLLYYNNERKKKHINVYDKNDNFLFECFSIKECIRQLSLNTIRGSSIQKCLSHKREYAYGYQFFRVTDPTQPNVSKIVS